MLYGAVLVERLARIEFQVICSRGTITFLDRSDLSQQQQSVLSLPNTVQSLFGRRAHKLVTGESLLADRQY